MDRRGDDKDDARKKEKGRRGEGKPAFGKYRFIEEPESVALSDFHSTPRCMHNRTVIPPPSSLRKLSSKQSYFSNIFDP